MAENETTFITPQNKFWTVTVEIKEQDPEKYLQRSFAFDYFYENGDCI